MEFDDEHKVKIGTLTLIQAQEFYYWLQDEVWRHRRCCLDAQGQMEFRLSIHPILKSAITRHTEDIEKITALQKQVREMFKL